jgi:hypothetical protein
VLGVVVEFRDAQAEEIGADRASQPPGGADGVSCGKAAESQPLFRRCRETGIAPNDYVRCDGWALLVQFASPSI